MTSLTHSKIICHFRSVIPWFPVYTFPSAEVEHGSWTMNPIDYRVIYILFTVFKKIFWFLSLYWKLVSDKLSPTYVIKIIEIYFWKRACGKYATKNNPSEASSPFNVHNFKSTQSYLGISLNRKPKMKFKNQHFCQKFTDWSFQEFKSDVRYLKNQITFC